MVDLLTGGVFIKYNVGTGQSVLTADIHQHTVRLQRFYKMVELLEGKHLIGGTAPGSIPAVYDQERDFSIPGQKLCYLTENLFFLSCSAGSVTGLSSQVEHGKIQTGHDSFPAECIQVGGDNVCFIRRIFYTVFGIIGGPEIEALVVLGCQGSELTAGAFCDACPLLTVLWSGGVEILFVKGKLPGQITVFMVVFPVDDVGVVVELEGCAVKMDKCAKAQIDKFFLQIF